MVRDTSYSPDVELDHEGRVVWAREVRRGETISIPLHMWAQLQRQTAVNVRPRTG